MSTLRTRRIIPVVLATAASLLFPVTGQASVTADCTQTSTGRTPISDMAPGETYLGEQGGLYPGGTNQRPSAHEQAGRGIAVNHIKPRTASGAIDPAGGLVGMISIGMSNTTQEFTHFMANVAGDPTLHPRLRLVDGAQGGQGAALWIDPAADTWRGLATRLQTAGVAPAQVQVLWLKQQMNGDNLGQFGPFPASAQGLRDHLQTIVRIAKQKYPNLRQAYLSSRIYGDYGSSTRGTGAYEQAFAVKWLVEDQIAGDPALAYNGSSAVAPWLSWGPYLWADGVGSDNAPGGTPGRADGLEWRCSDFNSDGIHPATSGKQKVATLLEKFFRGDTTTKPWFLTPQNPAPQAL
ncbi:MAG: hypothetical protein M3548_14245 [Actinomycetota bacterium]|nr:hypothetical protein [Actinomycetota bacterium]